MQQIAFDKDIIKNYNKHTAKSIADIVFLFAQ